LRFGILTLVSYVPELDGAAADVIEHVVADGALAEQLGFDSYWLTEHHFEHFGGLLSAPQLVMAAIAQRTARIRLGIGVSLLPLHHPLTLAEEWATADVLSHGRLELGIGMGFFPWEYRNFGVELAESHELLEEALDILVAAWSSERFDHSSARFQWRDLQILPHPIQRPHPPIWSAAVKTDSNYTWAGRRGLHLMTAPFLTDYATLRRNVKAYREALADSGFNPDERNILANLHVCVAPTREEAVAAAEPCLQRTNEVRAAVFKRMAGGPGAGTPASASLRSATTEDLIRDGKLVVGSPEDCVRTLRVLREEFGVTDFLGTFHFGGMPRDMVHRSMRLFMSDVAPRLAEPAAAAI
jgi:natural product biosynthesis luciferase-like monooxygenase protein